jgi:hypothetical protein
MSDELVPISDIPDEHLSDQPVPPEDLPNHITANSGDPVHPSDLPPEILQQQYGSHPVVAGLEGVFRGMTGGLSDVVADKMRSAASSAGLPDKYLDYVAPSKDRLQANQIINPASSEAGNVTGQVATLAALPETKLLKGAGALSKIGSAALDQSLKMMALQGGTEASKYLTGDGDPSGVVASHIAKAGGIGLVSGGLYGAGTTAASKLLGTTNVGNKIVSALTGFGHGLTFPGEKILSLSESVLPDAERAGLDNASFKAGQKIAAAAHGKAIGAVTKGLSSVAGGVVGNAVGGNAGAITGAMAAPFFEDLLEPAIGKAATRLVGIPILKAASKGNLQGVQDLINYGTCAAKGEKMVSKGIEGLFSSGSNEILNPDFDKKKRDDLQEYMEAGGADKQMQDASQSDAPIQGYAEGGEVQLPPITQSNTLANELPAHNIMLSAAKGRVSSYLNSVRPLPKMNKLAYDMDHEHPQKKHEYGQVLDLANHPLSILGKVKDGSLTSDNVSAFKSMYPELHGELAKKINERIINNHIDEEKKPPYHVRQALSLFLGGNLDSSMKQPNIAAAQAVFMTQKQNQQMVESKQGQALSKMGQSAQTPGQAREKALTKT